ncbi:MAG: Asd/ArgC dimerization domain-containing protein [Terriglobales bacterium]
MPPYRIAIQGAPTLLGKELHAALEERHFPALPPTLLDAPGGTPTADAAPLQRRLARFDEEAVVLVPCTSAALAGVDAIFLAGTAAEAEAVAAMAPSRAVVVDLSNGLAEREQFALAGLEPRLAEGTPGAVVAHPAAQMLAHVLDRLQAAGLLHTLSATVFEPVSQRGWDGIEELQQQSARLLALQTLPEDVFGCQIAFNLRLRLGAGARPPLGALRRRIEAETARLHPGPAPALQLIQAPVFHACLLSLYVRFAPEVEQEALLQAMSSPWLRPAAEFPDVMSVAGTDAIALGPLRADAAGGWWLWAGVDNLRRTAFSAVDAALALLAHKVRA